MLNSHNSTVRCIVYQIQNKPCLSRNIEFLFCFVKPLLWYWYFPSMQTSVPCVAQSILAAWDPLFVAHQFRQIEWKSNWASPLSADSCLEPAPPSTTTCKYSTVLYNAVCSGGTKKNHSPSTPQILCKSGPEVGQIYAGHLVCNMCTGPNRVPPSRPGCLRTQAVASTQRVLFDKTPI